jgi:hypothetical protein
MTIRMQRQWLYESYVNMYLFVRCDSVAGGSH